MKTLTTLALLATGLMAPWVPAAAAVDGPAFALEADLSAEFDRRGRGRGRGGDDRAERDDDRRGGDDRGGRRPRIPGGSGCDDPHDIIEHPECRL